MPKDRLGVVSCRVRNERIARAAIVFADADDRAGFPPTHGTQGIVRDAYRIRGVGNSLAFLGRDDTARTSRGVARAARRAKRENNA